jgi:hypothetical protein
MSNKEISFEEKATIISSSPLEFRHRVVFVMCQNQLIKAYNDCARLAGDETFKTLPSEQKDESYISLSNAEKLELINNIILNIEDVKNTLWAAVVSANPDEISNSNLEG